MLILIVNHAYRDRFGDIDKGKSDAIVIEGSGKATIYLEHVGRHRIKAIVDGDTSLHMIRKKVLDRKAELEDMNQIS